LAAVRNAVKRNVSPEASLRRTGTIAVEGRETPGLSIAIAGSFQAPIRPSYIRAITSPLSRRSLTPGTL
jgi:hypothetical protein